MKIGLDNYTSFLKSHLQPCAWPWRRESVQWAAFQHVTARQCVVTRNFPSWVPSLTHYFCFRSSSASVRSRVVCSLSRSLAATRALRRWACRSSARAPTATGVPSTTWTWGWCPARCTATRRSGHTRDTASSSYNTGAVFLPTSAVIPGPSPAPLDWTTKTVFIAHHNVTIKLQMIKNAQNHNDNNKFRGWDRDNEAKTPLIKSVRPLWKKKDVLYKVIEIRSWTIWKQFTCFSELWYLGYGANATPYNYILKLYAIISIRSWIKKLQLI